MGDEFSSWWWWGLNCPISALEMCTWPSQSNNPSMIIEYPNCTRHRGQRVWHVSSSPSQRRWDSATASYSSANYHGGSSRLAEAEPRSKLAFTPWKSQWKPRSPAFRSWTSTNLVEACLRRGEQRLIPCSCLADAGMKPRGSIMIESSLLCPSPGEQAEGQD